MSVTIKDVAREAGVSYSTVSKALNNSPLVKEKTKKHIVAIAKKMGYQPNLVAKSLVSRRSKIIGVVWPRVERLVWSSLVTEVNNALAKHSYNLLISINPVPAAISVFNQFRADAILIFREFVSKNQKVVPLLGVPLLYYGSPLFSCGPTVNVRREKAIYIAVEHLAHLGHKRIAYMGDLTDTDPTQAEKIKGFRKGITDFGTMDDLEIQFNTGDNSPDAGYFYAKKLIASVHKPTAVVVASYGLTSGAMRAFSEAKIKIPEDLSIISYDNIPQMLSFDVPLTVVGASVENTANTIVNTLKNLVEGIEEIPDYTQIDIELVKRASCAPPKGRVEKPRSTKKP